MKTHIHAIAIGLCLLGLVSVGLADDCGVSNFVQSVNEEWVSRDYPGIRQLIDTRQSLCTNDLLSLAMNFCYYFWAEVDFSNAQSAALAFVATVSNRAPDEVNQPGVFMASVKSIAEMTPPSTFPTNQARTADQIDYLHEQEYPTSFPDIDLVVELVTRVNEQP